jgi:hypothetical protein
MSDFSNYFPFKPDPVFMCIIRNRQPSLPASPVLTKVPVVARMPDNCNKETNESMSSGLEARFSELNDGSSSQYKDVASYHGQAAWMHTKSTLPPSQGSAFANCNTNHAAITKATHPVPALQQHDTKIHSKNNYIHSSNNVLSNHSNEKPQAQVQAQTSGKVAASEARKTTEAGQERLDESLVLRLRSAHKITKTLLVSLALALWHTSVSESGIVFLPPFDIR